jgi:steroid 5-alpha reductase family enzyme
MLQEIYLTAGLVILGYVTLIWVLSLLIQDAGIMDMFWGLGFVAVAGIYLFSTPEAGLSGYLLSVLVVIWGLRLTIYIAFRNLGKAEDARYQAFRKKGGTNWWWQSWFKVFLLQGLIMWIVSLPLLTGLAGDTGEPVSSVAAAGIVLWGIGFFFEAAGDWQLARFKRDPDNKGKVFDMGLWSLTRHPNYFGEMLIWWGFYLISLQAGNAWTVMSPLIMTVLLLRVSGVAMLEQLLTTTKPEYPEYIRTTSAFFPWFKKAVR